MPSSLDGAAALVVMSDTAMVGGPWTTIIADAAALLRLCDECCHRMLVHKPQRDRWPVNGVGPLEATPARVVTVSVLIWVGHAQ